MVAYTVIPALERLRQEDCKSEASLGYTRSHLDSKLHKVRHPVQLVAMPGIEFQPEGRIALPLLLGHEIAHSPLLLCLREASLVDQVP